MNPYRTPGSVPRRLSTPKALRSGFARSDLAYRVAVALCCLLVAAGFMLMTTGLFSTWLWMVLGMTLLVLGLLVALLACAIFPDR